METKVDQTLGDIIHGDMPLIVHDASIQDAFMSDQAMVARIQNLVIRLQMVRDIVGV